MDKILLYLDGLLWQVLAVVSIIVPLLICVAYLTYAERRIIAFVQLRKGPNVVGFLGYYSRLLMQ